MSDTIETLIDRLTDRQRHEFALRCARRVQHLMHDQRSIAMLDTEERWLRGEATDAAGAAAWAAGLAAADAARAALDASWAAAAADAAQAAAWAAAWAAADAARAAADAARAAAWADAWAAERAWQRAELERMLGEGGGA